MNASEACCVCGGGVRPEFCKTHLAVTCSDAVGAPIMPAARCEPIMSCGCGSAPCAISTAIFGPNVSNFSALPTPAYGQDGFWARSAFFEDDPSRLSHKAKAQMQCEEGFRAVPRGTVNVSSCDTKRSFEAECKDCTFGKRRRRSAARWCVRSTGDQ